MNAAGAIDFDHLHIYTGGDPDLEREVLGLFCRQADIWLRLLDEAGDDQSWKDAAHSLKGSARAVGAKRVAELCLDAELLTGEENEAARRTVFRQIRAAVADAIECADARLITLKFG